MSGSGKGSVLRALEDLGYYSVDNLPVDLIPTFAELVRDSATIRHAALVVDVREGVGPAQVSRDLSPDQEQRERAAGFSGGGRRNRCCAGSAKPAGRIR